MEKQYMTGKEIGQRLRRARMALNMSQQVLADLVSTSPQNISKYEKDGISNIEMIQLLSNALGHDLLTDETDAEGTVGIIGKEILAVMVENQGMMYVSDLSDEYMHGMSDERVSREIFKLERIGMCVREQYRNYYDELIDSLFLTAKGLICFKNECNTRYTLESGDDYVSEVITWENRLERKEQGERKWYENYQEKIDSDKLQRMVRNIPESNLYRREYIYYLKKNYQTGEDYDRGVKSAFILSDVNCYHDILLRMAVGLSDQILDIMLEDDNDEFDELHEELFGGDPVLLQSKWNLEKMISALKDQHMVLRSQATDVLQVTEPDLEEAKGESEKKGTTPEEMTEREKKLKRFFELVDKDYYFDRFGSSLKDTYLEEAAKHESPYMMDWFTKEDVEGFLQNQLITDHDDKEKIDAYLAEINRQYPKTLSYYSFPQEWEENGLADIVRTYFAVPLMNKETVWEGNENGK